MKKIIELFNDGSISTFLESVGKIATAFNPTLGSGLMLASNITDNFKEVNDDFLENEVIGIGGSVRMLRTMIETKSVDYELLEVLANNLDSIKDYLDKSNKLIK
jgi:hypothetical protein